MKLEDVIAGLAPIHIQGSTQVEVTGVCHDSRHFQPGDVFVAVRGHQFDGHLFVAKACETGAPAVVLEDDRVVSMRYHGTVIKIKNTRQAIDVMAANFFGRPSEKLFVAGVTGTNGKTTTTHMIEAVLSPALPTAVMGTIDNHFRDKRVPSTHTTPDALDIQSLLADWLKNGAQAVTLEVSSHALALARVDSVQFDVGVFTNLTRDHLDFHKSMDEYIKAKARLFRDLLKKSVKKNKRAVMNVEDSHFDSLVSEVVPTWTYGFSKGDIQASNVQLSFDGSQFDVKAPQGNGKINLQMIGRHNVANALAAIGVGLHAGLPLEKIGGALQKLPGVRGRMERVPSSSPVRVFVDYAHSDDALKNVLGFLRKLREDSKAENSRLITVFGCGGDRDRGKRPLMMKVAQSLSDVTVVTSDNPRTEEPQAIIKDILAGANPAAPAENLIVEADRREAIRLAVKAARPADVILIAGKGHEDYQIIGTKKYPFDDIQVAREILNKGGG